MIIQHKFAAVARSATDQVVHAVVQSVTGAFTAALSLFSVLNSSGSAFSTSRDVLNSSGTPFTVSASVLNSSGASFDVL